MMHTVQYLLRRRPRILLLPAAAFPQLLEVPRLSQLPKITLPPSSPEFRLRGILNASCVYRRMHPVGIIG